MNVLQLNELIHIRKRINKRLKSELDITLNDAALIEYLNQLGETAIPMEKLKELQVHEQQTVIVSRLVKKKLLSKKRNEDDERRVTIYIDAIQELQLKQLEDKIAVIVNEEMPKEDE